jgi:hypothetical protein
MPRSSVFSLAGQLPLPEAAAAYAAAGMPVFPCAPGAKRPLTRHGFTDATTDLQKVARWWRRWPQANIGLPTGQAGFDVVDIDVHPTGSGFAALARARRAGLAEGWSHLVRTPSGGVHLYFPAVVERPQESWSLPHEHVDFRGTGGYVIAPPSLVATGDGRQYGYILIATGAHPQAVDAVALRRLLAPHWPSRAPTQRQGLTGGTRERLEAWLAAQSEGNRNRALFWAACRQAEAGIPQDQTRERLGAAAARAGLDEREIEATVASAYRRATFPPVASAERTSRPRVTGPAVAHRTAPVGLPCGGVPQR